MGKTMLLEGAVMSSTIEGHFGTTAPSMENWGSARSCKQQSPRLSVPGRAPGSELDEQF